MTSNTRANSPEPPGPLPIRRLGQSLVNRIAAGEIIHRPASALKEILENSLDAGATSIRITVKDGGLKLLQLQDNGCGIRKADLAILAERFTTSKLSKFSDLSHLTTYGFRGEALASISHVSRLSVITKVMADTCAWKACYLDGALVPHKPGQLSEPKACAGNDGTTIVIEDLFYNIPTRLSALRSPSEEYGRILDLLTRYAIHNSKVSFSCKKVGSSSPDLSTPSGSETTHAIRLLYGHSIAKELLEAKILPKNRKKKRLSENDDELLEDNSESWTAEALFTNANYQAKKMTFILFINHRLVESPRTKRAVESIYNGILPKGSFPFVYLSLMIDPRAVDVNVHPTKREVHFLNEETIIETISESLGHALASQGQSRAFECQTLLTGGIAEPENINSKKRKGKEKNVDQDDETEGATPSTSSGDTRKKVYSHQKVRTSLHDRTLDSMFPVANPAQVELQEAAVQNPETPKTREIKESDCSLTSVKTLRQAFVKDKHQQLTEILEKHTFVGIVDLERCLSLIQHSTNLYLVNHTALAEELFYQLGLRQFGDINRLRLEPPPPLRSLVEIAVQVEETKDSPLSKAEIVNRIVDILIQRRSMLSEYFSLDISESGLVESLPLLLRDYTPNLDNLPNFLMRLGPQVDWQTEIECFNTFFRELAYFYTPGPSLVENGDTEQEEAQEKAERWQIQHILFPAMRRYLQAPKSLLDRDVVQIACLPDLYKVFERC
ncbi:histidine kinase-like ATPase [Amanita rubescens]|nr:histidine kinase-like ATPase [Amanita rubescens]